jgi:hypothetical protein
VWVRSPPPALRSLRKSCMFCPCLLDNRNLGVSILPGSLDRHRQPGDLGGLRDRVRVQVQRGTRQDALHVAQLGHGAVARSARVTGTPFRTHHPSDADRPDRSSGPAGPPADILRPRNAHARIHHAEPGGAYVVALTAVALLLGAAGMYAFERDGGNEQGFSTFAGALWWTAMLLTTMGSEHWPRKQATSKSCARG